MQPRRAFTIVELLIVVVVIGILAAITITSYSSVTTRATIATMQSDLENAKKQITLFYVQNGSYPTANNCPSPGATEVCLKASGGNSLTYTTTSSGFLVTETNGSLSYQVTDSTTPASTLSLVTSGLILELDASNPASYPGTGVVWHDISGKAADGTLNGAISFVSNGSQSYMNFATAADTNYVSSTLSQGYVDCTVVFYPDFSLVSQANLVEIISNGTTTDKSLRFDSANGIGPWSIASRNPGDTNDWANPTATTYYINGNSSTATLSAGWNIIGGYRTNQTNFPASFAYFLGTGYSGRGFQGRIAFVALYNRQLSAAEQLQNFNALRGRYGI